MANEIDESAESERRDGAVRVPPRPRKPGSLSVEVAFVEREDAAERLRRAYEIILEQPRRADKGVDSRESAE